MRNHLRFLCCLILLLFAYADVMLAQQESNATSSQSPEATSLIKQAFAREDAGDLKGAIEVYQKLLQLEPKDVRAMNTIAGLYGKLGDFEEEMVWAKKAIAENPQFHLAYINYGNALGSLGRVDEARAAFEKAVQLDPKEPLAVYSLGVLAEQQEDYKTALELYKKSTELDPKFENGYFNLAATYANLKRFDEAIAALKKLLELNPRAEDAKAMLADIEKEKRKRK